MLSGAFWDRSQPELKMTLRTTNERNAVRMFRWMHCMARRAGIPLLRISSPLKIVTLIGNEVFPEIRYRLTPAF
jgi:hypothetical protein